MNYVELHCHSNFSFLEGASHPRELAQAAARLGYQALALTDRDGLYGAVRFQEAADEAGIKAIHGSEVTFDDGSRLTLIARTQEGYANLSALITAGRRAREKGKSATPRALLATRSKGIIALSGDAEGIIPRALLGAPPQGPGGAQGHRPHRDVDVPRAEAEAAALRDLFDPGCFFLEVMNHHLPYEARLNGALMDLSRRLSLPIVATHDVRYHDRSRRQLMDLLTCTRHHTCLQDAGRLLFPNDDFALLSPIEAATRWAACPQALRSTERIAEMCTFDLRALDVSLPTFAVPPAWRDDQDYLEHLTFLGAAERFDDLGARQIHQLHHELNVIAELGLAGYFLIVWDIMRFCQAQGIFAQGRGSAANSAVCFALGITNVDPMKLDLLFERFLSEGRSEPPDIDIDIANSRREEVIQYVYQTYGREHAGMVCEVITYRARSAVRDVAKAFGLSPTEVDALAKRIDGRRFGGQGVVIEGVGQIGGAEKPGGERRGDADQDADQDVDQDAEGDPRGDADGDPDGDLREDADGADEGDGEGRSPAAQEGEAGEAALSPGALGEATGVDPRLIDVILHHAQALEGFPRHLGIHVGGMILCGAPLGERVPIENASMADRTVIQWDKDDIGALHVPKIDLLGLGMLSLLSDCLALIRVHEGIHLNPARLPHDDPATYDMICAADTVGVFQIESRAQMNTLPRMRPRAFYDLVVEVALIRPGPLQGNMVHPYLRRRNGEEAVTYPHPDLEPVLARTLGVPLFQEQGMKVAITAAGFTPKQADDLRRAMKSRRLTHQMEMLRTLLVQGMLARGYDPDITQRVVAQIEAFSSYGFPESHAASFAFLVYLSAYLKRHHPAAFYCALLNNQPMGFYSPATIVADARRHDVVTHPMDITRSTYDWQIEGGGLRPGLRAIKGLGQTHWEALKAQAPYRSIEDVCARAGLPRLLLERLAQAGAFSAFQGDRRRALWTVQGHRERPGLARHAPREAAPALDPTGAAEALVQDLATKGFSAEDHPLRHMESSLKRWGVLYADALPDIPHGRRIRIAGLTMVRQRPPTAKGFCFLTLEDPTGMLNVVVAPDVYEAHRQVVRRGRLLVIEGRIEKVRGVINIRAEKLGAIDDRFSEHLRSRDFH